MLTAKPVVVCRKVIGRSPQGIGTLGSLHVNRKVNNDRLNDLVLDRKNILYVPIIAFRPEMLAARRFKKLGGDPNVCPSAPYTSFKKVLHSKGAPDLVHVGRAILIRERGIARNHTE